MRRPPSTQGCRPRNGACRRPPVSSMVSGHSPRPKTARPPPRGSRPKEKVATLPAVNMAGTSEPYWGQVRPFVLHSWDECAVPAPPDYSADTSSARFHDAHEVLQAKSSLTSEQKKIALYWADNAGESGTPVGHWVAIGAQMVSE